MDVLYYHHSIIKSIFPYSDGLSIDITSYHYFSSSLGQTSEFSLISHELWIISPFENFGVFICTLYSIRRLNMDSLPCKCSCKSISQHPLALIPNRFHPWLTQKFCSYGSPISPWKWRLCSWTCPGSHSQQMPEPEFLSFLCVVQLLRNKADEPLSEHKPKGKASSAMRGFGANTCEGDSSCLSPFPSPSVSGGPAAGVKWTEAHAWSTRNFRGSEGWLPRLWSRVLLTSFKMWQSLPCSNLPLLKTLYASTADMRTWHQVYTWISDSYFESWPRYGDFDNPDHKIRKALSIGVEHWTRKENASEYAYYLQQSKTYVHVVHWNYGERWYRKLQESYSQWELMVQYLFLLFY